uniref:Uncharacterized protein n=1 Tax=Arundo donax TaxID=35708 RepID=A0A0A9EME8_ARUDO
MLLVFPLKQIFRWLFRDENSHFRTDAMSSMVEFSVVTDVWNLLPMASSLYSNVRFVPSDCPQAMLDRVS